MMWTLNPVHHTKVTTAVHCGRLQNYVVKNDHEYRLLQFQGSLNKLVVWLKEVQNTIIINQRPHNSTQLQKASTNSSQQAV